jgi:hypothetical protein
MGKSQPMDKHSTGSMHRRALLPLMLGAALALSGCIADPQPVPTDGGTAPQSTTPAATGDVPTTTAPLETAQASNKAPVYWVGRSNDDFFLYREFRDVPAQENPVTSALRAMMSEEPLDPDFFTPWQNPKKLATSISGKNVITVDVSADAFNSNLDAETADRAVQQLVYTATAAGASAGLIDTGQQLQVVVLVDGHTGYLGFGHVRLGTPISRSTGMVAPVWIIDPQEGTEFPDGVVKINGRSTSPGSKLRWRLLRVEGNSDKTSYLSGEVTASADPSQSGVFALTVNLGPGKYELRVYRSLSAQGDAEVNVDSRGFVVR